MEHNHFRGSLGMSLRRSLAHWARLHSIPALLSPGSAGLKLSKVHEQKTLHQAFLLLNSILKELWNGVPDDHELLSAVSEYFIQEAQHESQGAEDEGDSEFPPELPRLSSGSDFHKAIFNLFVWEFYCHADLNKTGAFLSMLHGTRREAALYMSCARLARRSLPDLYMDTQKLPVSRAIGTPS